MGNGEWSEVSEREAREKNNRKHIIFLLRESSILETWQAHNIRYVPCF